MYLTNRIVGIGNINASVSRGLPNSILFLINIATHGALRCPGENGVAAKQIAHLASKTVHENTHVGRNRKVSA